MLFIRSVADLSHLNKKRLVIINCLFLFILHSSYNSFATSRYWVGGTGNWTNATSHWANSSGGSPGAGNIPTSSDDVFFDSNSGVGTVTVNSAVTVVNITFSSSCSAIILDITLNTTAITSASGGIVLNSGSEILRLSGGTLTVTDQVYVDGGTMQLNSGTLNVNCFTTTGTFGLVVDGGTLNCAGATINIGNGSNEVLDLESGTLTVSAGTINVRTEFYTRGGTFNHSGGTINVNISTSSERFYSITMVSTTYNLTGGIIDVKNIISSGALAIRIDATCTPGTLTGGVLRVSATNFNYSMEIDVSIYSLEVNSAGKTASINYHNLDLTGNFILTAGTFDIGTNLYNMNVGGDWTNNGTAFTCGTQTVTFDGSSAQKILGATATSFYNMILSNSTGLTLAPSAGIKTTVLNTLTMSSGKITLGNFDLNIGATGVSGSIASASSAKYIITNGTGVLRQYEMGTGKRTSVAFPVGISSTSYTPITWNISGSSTVDNFSVVVSQGVLLNGTSGSAFTSNVVDRTWNVTEGTATGSSATLTAQWNAVDELTSFNRSSCHVSHYTSGWSQTSTDAASSGAGPYTRVSGTVTSFSPFAIGYGTTLPIELLSFDAIPFEKDVVQLNWITLSENNNNYFTVERSTDAINFEPIIQIEGAHFSNTQKNYMIFDSNFLNGVIYYRLKQTDYDGNSIYSKVVSVNFGETDSKELFVFPNPVTDITEVTFVLENGKSGTIYVNDEDGKIVFSKAVISNGKKNNLKIDFREMQPGVYYITFIINTKLYTSKIMKL